MTVREFMHECIDYGDLDADIFICVDKWLLKPIEEERFAYISIKEVKPFGSCMYCEPVYSSGIDYQGLPPVTVETAEENINKLIKGKEIVL